MVSLQFITHQTERYSYLESARMALEGGCKWIQLRMKEAPLEEVEAVALQLKPLCKEHEAILVLDDHVELARKYIRRCCTALSCRCRLSWHRSFPVYYHQKEFKPCTGIGRLFLHPFTDERGEYRNPRSSDWRNHL